METTAELESAPPSGVYRRDASDATSALRFGETYPGGGRAEFEALSRLYAADPEHVARPIDLNTDSDGNVVGYDMEFIEGPNLFEYLQEHGFLPEGASAQIRDALKVFHASGVVHGDVNPKNIILTTNGTIKFVDPVGFGKINPDDLKRYIDADMEAASRLIGS